MSRAKELIVRPLVTEKTMKVHSDNNTVVFEVNKNMNKIHIRQAIEEIYNVKVDSVNIVNTATKQKRVGRYVGTIGSIKKAYVKLAKGSSIDILGDK